MKKILRNLKGKKGFTLLECIIAIAVFAALTLVVMAMLTYARNEAVNANETEENLTLLIENVISDDSQKKYYDGSDVLSLEIGDGSGDSFDISYNLIDGYKNFIVCQAAGCGYHADNTVFMLDTKQEDFVQTDALVCPKCGHENYIELTCQDCLNKGDHNDINKFKYIPTTGGFYCLECGISNVRDQVSADLLVSKEQLSVKGMVANAVVYGGVPATADDSSTPENEKEIAISNMLEFNYLTVSPTAIEKTTEVERKAEDGDSDVNVNVNLTYEVKGNQTVPGVYKLKVSKPSITSHGTSVSENFSVRIMLPPYYRLVNLQEVDSSLTDGLVRVAGDTDPDTAARGEQSWIDFYFTSGHTDVTAEFQLINYKSGHSFDYDYATGTDVSMAGHGLVGHWFGANVTNYTMPSSEEKVHPKELTANFTLTKK